jgi:hypothetical protein
MHTWFWPGNMKERDGLEDLGIDGVLYENGHYRNRIVGGGLDSAGSG